MSADPMVCNCYCFGEGSRADVVFDPGTPVDISINDLPVFEAATFLDSVYTERILVPVGRAKDAVTIQVKGEPLRDIVRQVGLTTQEDIDRQKRRAGWSMFFAGFAVGATTLVWAARRRN